ncbi:MAG: carboxypeptidase-like regulatory domain-containing protein [Sandaracinaceae bacterium]|nr:carboxypeptidase-like regulatory domain-containing protein [Sandaracinaceae bacterium]
MHRQRPPAYVPAAVTRRLGVGLALALAALALAPAGCDTNSVPGESYEIVGFIVEAQGTGGAGPPIANAMVRFENDTGRHTEGVSESDGHFRLFIYSETRFGELSASAPGFQDARATVYFDTPSRRVDLALPRELATAP